MTGAADIDIARVYAHPARDGRALILVDRLWPRGIRKEELGADDWIKEVAPSNELRKWFGHDPALYDEFRRRYRAQLDANPQAVGRCLEWCRKGPVRLLYGAKDEEHNQAVVLRDYLIEKSAV